MQTPVQAEAFSCFYLAARGGVAVSGLASSLSFFFLVPTDKPKLAAVPERIEAG